MSIKNYAIGRTKKLQELNKSRRRSWKEGERGGKMEEAKGGILRIKIYAIHSSQY